MNGGNKLAVIFASVSAVIIIGIAVVKSGEDRTAPTIIFTNNNISYTDHMDRTLLMKGVAAMDDRDGDVTGQIVIEKITRTTDAKAVIVTYAVMDKSNNFTKSSRVYQTSAAADTEYKSTINAAKPKIVEEESLEQQTETVQDEEAGSVQAEENSVSETENAGTINPILLLSSTEATIQIGMPFNINDYIVLLSDDTDAIEVLQHRIQTNGTFDNTAAGDYPVAVVVSDSEGNRSEVQNLMIHVVE